MNIRSMNESRRDSFPLNGNRQHSICLCFALCFPSSTCMPTSNFLNIDTCKYNQTKQMNEMELKDIRGAFEYGKDRIL